MTDCWELLESTKMAKKEDYLEIFKMADQNKDGFLTFDELLNQLKKFGYKGTEASLETCFKTANNTVKNKLNKEEFLQAMDKAPPIIHQVALMRRIFTKLDLDNSGTLDRKEMELALTFLGENFTKSDMDTLMAIIDKDDSNTIDLEEFIQAFLHFERK